MAEAKALLGNYPILGDVGARGARGHGVGEGGLHVQHCLHSTRLLGGGFRTVPGAYRCLGGVAIDQVLSDESALLVG